MTAIDPQLLEQLSAWMDGELPADEARFLQRRLGNDLALREQWERWQLASTCLRREPVRLTDHDLAARVAAGIAKAADDPAPPRRNVTWLASAAALVLAAVMLPAMLAVDPRGDVSFDALTASSSQAADALVEPRVSPAPSVSAALSPPMSPLPSVRDFPLADNGGKGWPRSPLLIDPRARDGFLIGSTGPFQPLRDAEPAPPAAGVGETDTE